MDYGISDSSGTDDDLPPSQQNRFHRGGHVAVNGRGATLGSNLPRANSDMETKVHLIEQEAYTSVLRAFKAQSDAITWEKESLITELRKELRVSDEEHRELLARVNNDDIICQIREWRKANGLQSGARSSIPVPVHDPVPSPTVSASRKKQKTSQSVASLSIGAPSMLPSIQPSSSNMRRGPPTGPKSKKPKSYPAAGLIGRPVESATYDPLIGRKVWTRWPDDNNFYEAIISDYDPAGGRHALVYDMNTARETWEWVNLKEISPEDIRWEGDDPAMSRKGGRPGPGRGVKKSTARGGGATGTGRGRGSIRTQAKKELPLVPNGIGKKGLGDIEILHTDTLIKEVEKVFGSSHPDPMEIEKAKKVLKEHEQALVEAIARLEDASDGESADGEARRKSQYEDMAPGSEGNKMARDGQQNGDREI